MKKMAKRNACLHLATGCSGSVTFPRGVKTTGYGLGGKARAEGEARGYVQEAGKDSLTRDLGAAGGT